MDSFNVAVLVNNQFGVLNRVTSMFRRRQFNITSLNVTETENSEFSRITVKAEGDTNDKQKLINQLYKLPDVVSIKELDADSITCEALLIKVANDPDVRSEIMDAANAFGAKPVCYDHESIVLQLTDSPEKITDFVEFLLKYNVLEICRTGMACLDRGEKTLRVASFL